MANTPKKNGRKPDGRFAKGNKLGGRTPGARNQTTLAVEALLQGEHEALTRAAIEKALEGDATALRLCLDRIAPARKDTPVSFRLPPIKSASEALAASSAILAAVAEGEITPDEAGRVMALLDTHKRLIEAHEFDERLKALEKRQ